MSIIDGDHQHTKFMLSNFGTRPATLESIEIEGKTKGGIGYWNLQSNMLSNILKVGETYNIDASNGYVIPGVIEQERRDILKEKYGFKENCRLLISYIEMNGKKIIFAHPFMCDPVSLEDDEIGLNDRK